MKRGDRPNGIVHFSVGRELEVEGETPYEKWLEAGAAGLLLCGRKNYSKRCYQFQGRNVTNAAANVAKTMVLYWTQCKFNNVGVEHDTDRIGLVCLLKMR